MQRRGPVAALIAIVAAVLLGVPAMAATLPATATADLIAGPPSDSWTADQATGPLTVDDIYGSSASSAHGFVDAYQKVWSQSGVWIYDQLERYTTVLWAAYALGGSYGGDQRDASHTSFKNLSGFGSHAYEVTFPADSDGYKWDDIVFAEGDYLASIFVGSKVDVLHEVALDQANRQLALLPVPTSELRSIGFGVIGGFAIAGLAIMAVAAAVVVLVIVLVRRRREPAMVGAYAMPPASTMAAQMSDDRRYWWDGHSWQDTSVRIPPWAQVSADGTQWWDGATWRPMPSRPY